MPASSTYTPIATLAVTVDGTTQDIGFNSIPQIYTDLEIVIQYRTDFSSNSGISAFYFNSDSATANRSYTILTGNGSSATSTRSSGDNRIQISTVGTTPYAATTAGVFAVAKVAFLNYSNTTTFKTMTSKYSGDFNGSGNATITTGLVRSTAALTDIRFATYGNGFYKAGTTITLYGIAAA
jgi:hypothetical protein